MIEEINGFRKEFDKIDLEILEIIKKRLILSRKIGEFKKKNCLKIRDRKREKELIEDRLEKSSLDSGFIKKLFKLILKESRRVQNE